MAMTETRAGIETAKHYIDGEWVASTGAETMAVVDPATEETIATIPAGTSEDVDAAVAAARRASSGWMDAGVEQRKKCLVAAGAAVRAAALDLARLEAAEMGKVVSEAARDIEEMASAFDQYADLLESHARTELRGDESATDVVVREPHGVAALIVPWNYPLVATLTYLPGLLGAGNTVVLKPSERSPLSAIGLVDLLELPPGVLNVVLGDGRAGAPLAAHPDVDFVSFTGSTAVGRSIASASASHLRPVALELGGKDPVIVDSDVDPGWAAEQVAIGAFTNTGQICTSMERIYVHRAVYEPFVDRLTELAAAHVLGPGTEESTTLGPLVDERQRQIVASHVEDALARGARALTGGSVPNRPGFFYPPTVLVDVTDDMVVMNEETFGPVAPVMAVSSFEEALEKAISSEYGLAATVLTRDRARAEAAARALPAAIVWVNEWQGGHPDLEYEPSRSSGYGRTGGRAWLDTVTRPKAIHMAPAPEPG